MAAASITILVLAALHTALATASAESVAGGCLHEPATRIDCYPPVANFPNVTEEACFAQGCCWKALDNDGVPCAFDARGQPDDVQCARVPPASRLECRNPRYFTQLDGDERTCHAVGCCFDTASGMCFQPFFAGYELLTLDELDDGWRGALVLPRFTRGPFGNDVPLLQLRVVRESEHRVRMRITDPAFPRYEVPDVVASDAQPDHTVAVRHEDCAYRVHFARQPFGIAVTHRASGDVLFNSTPPTDERGATAFNGLVFANQFLELSTQLESHSRDAAGDQNDSEPVLFGLGERVALLRLHADDRGDHYPMFARAAEVDAAGAPHTREGGDNLSGVHPFWLQVRRRSGAAHGVFLLSSNAMEVVTQRRALTYRTTGGVLDLFVFAGPTPKDVVAQYSALVGRPAMPPYWALGYHLGAPPGTKASLNDSVALVARMRSQGVPLEALWFGTEYMDHERAFTLDEARFPRDALRQFVDDLHFHDQYIVAVQTPAISTERLTIDDDDEKEEDTSDNDGAAFTSLADASANTTLRRGEDMHVFVRGVAGEAIARKVVGATWSAFVDFFHPNASTFWREQLAALHDELLPFDGLWLDLNEPSSVCDSAFAADADACPETATASAARAIARRRDATGDPDDKSNEITFESVARVTPSADGGFVRSSDVAFPFDPYRQPFAPGQNTQHRGGHGNLNSHTLPMAASHYTSLHYNLHSLYGHAAARTTRAALDHVLQRRSVLLARSTFAGSGRFAGHWLGTAHNATWSALQLAVAGVLQMNLFGIPLVGPTICGDTASSELCVRWHQAAAFFPLVRAHMPVDFDADTVNLIRAALLQRYEYLPYLYTQFFVAHTAGAPVLRPLVLEFPRDSVAMRVEHQYLVGAALMVSPVVHEGAIAKRVYFPDAIWYDAATGKQLIGAHDDSVGNADDSDNDRAAHRTVKLLTPLHALQLHVRGGFVVPTQQPAVTTTAARRGTFTLLVALDTAHAQPHAAGELFVDDGDSLNAVADARFAHIAFGAFQNASDRFDFKSIVRTRGYDGPELHAPLRAIKVYGLAQAFHANSSLHATLAVASDSDSSGSNSGGSRDVHVEYFANAQTLVISGLDVSIGQELHVQVVAHPGTPNDIPSGDKDAGAGRASSTNGSNHRSSSSSEEERNGGDRTRQPTRKQRYSVLAIIGAVVGALFLLGICVVCVLQRRRAANGYNPIA